MCPFAPIAQAKGQYHPGSERTTSPSRCTDSACQHLALLKVLLLLQGPSKQYVLGIFPSPLHRWYPPGIPEDVEFWIKRDDLTGMQLSGNKVQKPPLKACLFRSGRHAYSDCAHYLLPCFSPAAEDAWKSI